MSFTQASQTAIPCLTQAIEFLTRPLLIIYAPTKVLSIQLLLQAALTPLFMQRNKLVITVTGGTVAPRALYPTCIAAGVRWVDWFTLLGGFEFDLIVEPSSVVVCAMGQRKTIWVNTESSSTPLNPNADVFRSTTRQTLHATLHSAMERSRTRTVAQLILESPHEDLEADELFNCISKVSNIAPTPAPTQSTFSALAPPFVPTHHQHQQQPHLFSASEISRPSSRSSNSSSSSSSSMLSEESIATSITSMSSTSPVIAKIEVTPSITYFKRELPVLYLPQLQQQTRRVAVTRPTSTFTSTSTFTGTIPTQTRPPRFQSRTAAPIQAPAYAAATTQAPPAPCVDASKLDKTKYLYQGGVSTVLTGGVMLGGGAGAGAGAAQKPQRRVGGGVNGGNWRRF